MKIIRVDILDYIQKKQVVDLWNAEYPINISHDSTSFEDYLEQLINKTHYLIKNTEGSIIAWAVSFDRDIEKWFAMILCNSIQRKGVGTRLINRLKEDNLELNGWVVQTSTLMKSNSESYISPIQFYRKKGFQVIKNKTLENDKIPAIKIIWRKVVISGETKHRYYIFHKPYNCLSQFIFEGKRKSRKRLIGQFHDFPDGTMAIGRLDQNSEGLLLLTTNGKFSEEIRSAKYEKEYYVQVDGLITQNDINKLKNGVEISIEGTKYFTKKCDAELIEFPSDIPMENRKVRDEKHGPTSWISITITEGKFRQVRKMTAIIGFPTLRLIRVRIGNYKLTLAPTEIEEFIVNKH